VTGRADPAGPRALDHAAFLALVRTAAVLGDDLDRLLAPHGLSQPQYNVLRILRGAGGDGLCRHEIRDRLLSRMPDVTRLVDRLEESGLAERVRDAVDRRVVRTTITDAGRVLLGQLDAPVAAEHARQFGHLSTEEVGRLVALLDAVRQRPGLAGGEADPGTARCDG
jgi:DNA-binding MarR family transcriptional regulator